MRDDQNVRPLGHIVGLWRYPVKSMAGEPLSSVNVSWHGFAGDRRWAFIRDGVVKSGFPWLTLREHSALSHYRPFFVDPEQPDRSAVVVATPSGTRFDVTDPALKVELSAAPLQLIKQDRGVFDSFPLSLITTQTVDGLAAMVGTPLDVQRFRPNIVVKASEDASFPEDAWIGSVLRIGSMRMRIDKRDGRCAVITIDPATTTRNPGILRAVAREREGCAGVYGAIVEPGLIALQDPVFVEATRSW